MKKEIFILYIVKKKKESILKIGITRKSNFKSRISKIEKDFGKLNLKKSYVIYSYNQSEINNLEKLLHNSFFKYRIKNKFENGAGKTEWFQSKILKDVLNQVKYLKKTKSFKGLSILKRMDGKKRSYINYLSLVLYIPMFVSLCYLVWNK